MLLWNLAKSRKNENTKSSDYANQQLRKSTVLHMSNSELRTWAAAMENMANIVRSPCKISEPYDNPVCDFNNGGKKKKKKSGIIPKIVAYLSCSAGRTHFARTNNH